MVYNSISAEPSVIVTGSFLVAHNLTAVNAKRKFKEANWRQDNGIWQGQKVRSLQDKFTSGKKRINSRKSKIKLGNKLVGQRLSFANERSFCHMFWSVFSIYFVAVLSYPICGNRSRCFLTEKELSRSRLLIGSIWVFFFGFSATWFTWVQTGDLEVSLEVQSRAEVREEISGFDETFSYGAH